MSKVLVLRNADKNRQSYNHFQWPEKGPVECPDWNPLPVCGQGLHGLLWGDGNWSLLSNARDAIWQVLEVDAETIVKIDDGKVKFPRANVIYSGEMSIAINMVLNDQKRFKDILEISKKLSSGKSSKAASSGYYSRAASSGDYSTAASSGKSSKAASSGESSTAASSGDSSRAASSGYYSTAKAEGKNTIAMAAGTNCYVQAGENGCFAACWYDPKAKRNRIKVGYVGRKGIKANTLYRIVDGQWVEV